MLPLSTGMLMLYEAEVIPSGVAKLGCKHMRASNLFI